MVQMKLSLNSNTKRSQIQIKLKLLDISKIKDWSKQVTHQQKVTKKATGAIYRPEKKR